jgi:hypothetical protein
MCRFFLSRISSTKRRGVPYKILRLDAIAGMNAQEAIGMLVAGKTGAKVPYTRQDLKYDLATQVIQLVSTSTADPDDPDELDRRCHFSSLKLFEQGALKKNRRTPTSLVGSSEAKRVPGLVSFFRDFVSCF